MSPQSTGPSEGSSENDPTPDAVSSSARARQNRAPDAGASDGGASNVESPDAESIGERGVPAHEPESEHTRGRDAGPAHGGEPQATETDAPQTDGDPGEGEPADGDVSAPESAEGAKDGDASSGGAASKDGDPASGEGAASAEGTASADAAEAAEPAKRPITMKTIAKLSITVAAISGILEWIFARQITIGAIAFLIALVALYLGFGAMMLVERTIDRRGEDDEPFPRL